MLFVGGADKFIVSDVEKRPDFFEPRDQRIDKLNGRYTRFSGFLFHFLPVFVRSREEKHVLAEHLVIAREGIADDGRITMSDMPVAARVINRRGDIVFFFHILSPRRARTARNVFS